MGIPNHKDNNEITTDSIPCTYESNSLRCDASNTKIVTSDQDLHLSSGKTADNNTLLQIEMSDLNSTTFQVGGSSSSGYHTKSSSGLSGGAIAGIVIACVVVLVAATVAAVMLRKPTPPMENTTVVDLKTDNL